MQQLLTAPKPQTPAQRATTDRTFAGTAQQFESGQLAAVCSVGLHAEKASRLNGFTAQQRNPIITDPRVRDSRVGQRAPSLTELYAAESYMFLLQRGLNTVTGDPQLKPERRWQTDLGTTYDDDRFRSQESISTLAPN